MKSLVQDLGFAMRQFHKNPGAATLGLAISATTAISDVAVQGTSSRTRYLAKQ